MKVVSRKSYAKDDPSKGATSPVRWKPSSVDLGTFQRAAHLVYDSAEEEACAPQPPFI